MTAPSVRAGEVPSGGTRLVLAPQRILTPPADSAGSFSACSRRRYARLLGSFSTVKAAHAEPLAHRSARGRIRRVLDGSPSEGRTYVRLYDAGRAPMIRAVAIRLTDTTNRTSENLEYIHDK